MNIKVEIEMAFKDDSEYLERILQAFSDVLEEYGYANQDDDDSYAKSFIRVKTLSDDKVLYVVIPMEENSEKE